MNEKSSLVEVDALKELLGLLQHGVDVLVLPRVALVSHVHKGHLIVRKLVYENEFKIISRVHLLGAKRYPRAESAHVR